jgi:hypothetical protein
MWKRRRRRRKRKKKKRRKKKVMARYEEQLIEDAKKLRRRKEHHKRWEEGLIEEVLVEVFPTLMLQDLQVTSIGEDDGESHQFFVSFVTTQYDPVDELTVDWFHAMSFP